MIELLPLTPSELQDHIADLRKKVAADRQTYGEYRALLWPSYEEWWDAVGSALIARVNFYRGEVLRAKHNIARYMTGEPTKPLRPWMLDFVAELDGDIARLHNAIAEMQGYAEELKAFNEDGQPATQEQLDNPKSISKEYWKTSMLYNLSIVGIDLALIGLKDSKEFYEKYTYAG